MQPKKSTSTDLIVCKTCGIFFEWKTKDDARCARCKLDDVAVAIIEYKTPIKE
jgi:predicted Zn-ribbon and HTH transcriptional regulator